MGRSVSTPSGAVVTVYIDVSEYDSDSWDDFIEDVRNVVREKYPSFNDSDKWHHREDHEVMENGHAFITVSEYCGLAAVCMVPADGYDDPSRDILAASWCNRVAENLREHLQKRYPDTAYNKVATFSNGEGYYEKVCK